MTWVETLEEKVDDIFSISWQERDGRVVPTSADVTTSQAVKLSGTFLYADLAASAKLAEVCPWQTTAKIIRAYLDCSTRLIRAWGGEIRSFDGDRVMGVFIGDQKNTNASYCVREIFYTVEEIIAPKAEKKFKSIRENNIKIRNCVGIDTGVARAVRAGIRDNNDLIWIGRSPSLAAKLSDVRKFPYCVWMSKDAYTPMMDAAKTSDGKGFWFEEDFTFGGKTVKVMKTRMMKTP